MPGARHAEIDDLLQEALLRAYEARDRFESDEHAINWICHVVRNLLVDRRRRWLRRPVLPHANLDDIGDFAPDPADLVVAADQANLAVHALARLSQAQRDLLWEHVVDGVSYADIARRTETPLATVRSLAHRAKLAAVREFAHVGGALSALPALALQPFRRLAQRVIGVPSAAVEALAMVGAVMAVVATPPSVARAVVMPPVHPILAGAVAATPAPVATDTVRPTAALDDAAAEERTTAPIASIHDPTQLVESVQTGGFSGSYFSDCTFTSDTGVSIMNHYDCRFDAVSQICQVKLRESPAATTGCVLELRDADVTGLAVASNGVNAPQFNGLNLREPIRHCGSGGSGLGTVRFLAAAGAVPIDVSVSLVMTDTDVSITSKDVRTLGLSASFPFSCMAARQFGQVGFSGTLGT